MEKCICETRLHQSEDFDGYGNTSTEAEVTTAPVSDQGEGDLKLHHSTTSRSWHGDTLTPQLKDWQEEVEISKPRKNLVKTYLMAVAFMLFPSSFIGLGVAVAVLHNRPIFSGNYSILDRVEEIVIYFGVNQAIKVAVTVFPIGFGIILCKSLRNIANYKAEHGTRLITLEQLIASRSFGSALTSPLSFKRVNKTVVILFLLWLFSPITSQALQRMFTVGVDTSSSLANNVTYLDTTALGGPTAYIRDGGSTTDDGSYAGQSGSLLNAAISTTTWAKFEETKVDIFGNPKIPLIEDFEENDAIRENGYYNVDGDYKFAGVSFSLPTSYSWSSFLGLPLSGVPDNGTSYTVISNFSAVSGYFTVNCSAFQHQTGESIDSHYVYNKSSSFQFAVNCAAGYDCSGKYLGNSSNPSIGTSMFLGLPMARTSENLETFSPLPKLVFASRKSESPAIYATTSCDLKYTLVETNIECDGLNCRSTLIKRLPAGPPSDYGWNHDTPGAFLLGLAAASPALSTAQDGTSSALESWLFNPSKSVSGMYAGYQDMASVPLVDFNRRIALVLDTYWQAGFGPALFTDGTVLSNEALLVVGETGVASMMLVQTNTPVYQCSWGWLAVMLVSCAVVIAIIVANAWCECHVLGPDIMGYVSMMTRNNIFTPLPPGGGMLGGMERTVKLADLKVRLHDVRPDAPVGTVALASVAGKPLQKGRKYN